MRRLSILTLLLLLTFPALPQSRKSPAKKPSTSATKKSPPTRKKPSATKKSTKKSTAPRKKPAGSKKPASKARSTKSTKKGTTSTRSRAPSWRASQQVPTPQRYAEIQKALIDRGYLTGPSTGNWGPDSAEALRKFQEDQNLEPTGKLDSLSLIALGLGPSRDTTIPSPPASGGPKNEPKPPQ